MKKAISFMLCVLMFVFCAVPANATTQEKTPSVSAETFVLYCADNGQIIYSKNENKKMKPASTTKIMTSLLTLEEAASSNKKVTFTNDMVAEGSSMYLKIGDKVTLKDLAAGMMMASGNDAANAAAVTISGGAEKFSVLMNERAKQIGMKNTHFITPSGLDDDNHYSTAYDMALLMAYALENEDFANLTSKKSETVSFIEPQSKKTTYANHNRLLSLYKYCIGGKTGYTRAAGRCLVTAAKKDGLTLVCVTMNDRNDCNDHAALYEYGFEKYSYYETDDSEFCIDVPCVGAENENITLMGEKNAGTVVLSDDKNKIERKIFADSFLYAPIKENEVCGRIDYVLNGKTIASVNLVATDNVNSIKENKSIWTIIKEMFTYG